MGRPNLPVLNGSVCDVENVWRGVPEPRKKDHMRSNLCVHPGLAYLDLCAIDDSIAIRSCSSPSCITNENDVRFDHFFHLGKTRQKLPWLWIDMPGYNLSLDGVGQKEVRERWRAVSPPLQCSCPTRVDMCHASDSMKVRNAIRIVTLTDLNSPSPVPGE
jgi:hypothetical protein